MKLFAEKVCFVTGGASGIGKAIVTAFHEAGAKVAFCDADGKAGRQLEQKLDVRFFPVDVRNEQALIGALNAVSETLGEIDILVNNVGIGHFMPLEEASVEDFDMVIATNLRPVFITSHYLALRRKSEEMKSRFGRIVNIASTRYLQSEPGTEGYAASKGGIVSLTHALALSFSEHNVTVNCISPGWIDTGHFGALKPEDHKQHPSGRVGVPEDIARTCLFLADPPNDFINGQNIIVDGGMTKKMIYVE